MAVLSIDRKELDEQERWNESSSCLEKYFFRRIKILFGIMNRRQALLMLREDRALAISSLSIGWIDVKLLRWCFKYSEKCLWEYLVFCFVK